MRWRSALALVMGCSLAAAQEVVPGLVEPVPESVAAACGSCHAVPPPNMLAADEWGTLIVKMYLLAEQIGEPIIAAAPGEVTSWYRDRAPAELSTPVRNYPPITPAPVDTSIPSLPATAPMPMIGELAWIDLFGDGELLLVCDTGGGAVWSIDPHSGAAAELFAIGHPVSLQALDFNGDGLHDLLVGDLGSLGPDDGMPGRVWLAVQKPDRSFDVALVADGFGRVADARGADFDADGDVDLLVSAFGGLTVGGVHYLQNDGAGSGLRFVPRVLEAGSGSLQLATADFDGDGSLDFATGLAQEREQIVAWFGDDRGLFERRLLHAAPHPGWGFNRILANDLDGDGDTDLVVANGDTLDGYTLYKPWHGVSWLENDGGGNFSYRRVGDLYGATGLAVVDWNGDGLRDVVASSWMRDPTPREDGATPPGIVGFLQQPDGTFAGRQLLAAAAEVPVLALRAKPDDAGELALGRFALAPRAGATTESIQLLRVGAGAD